MQDEVTAILDGWTEVRAQDFGAFWLVVGVDPYGVPRGGSRADAIGLAHDLREISEREAPKADAIETPEPDPIEQAPAPEPVQPTTQEQVSASPVEEHEQPSTGDAADYSDEISAEQIDALRAVVTQDETEMGPVVAEPPPAAVVTEPSAPQLSDGAIYESSTSGERPANDASGDALQFEDAADAAPAPEAHEQVDGAPAYPGLMLQEDRENYLRGRLAVRITQIEKERLAARYDRNAQDRQNWGFSTYQNLSALELPIPDDVRAAYDEYMAAEPWMRATKDHASALRDAAITVGLDLLEAMQTSIEEGWP